MYDNKKVAVVVPAYNEESMIGKVIETMPDLVDLIIVVNDASTDGTASAVEGYKNKLGERLELLDLEKNSGVGAALESGYKRAYEWGADIAVVMAGDGQMDPGELEGLLDPVASGEADYTKGNRLLVGTAWDSIPVVRLLGNAALSVLTKISSGYWHVSDTQNGYTAINRQGLDVLVHSKIYARYGVPNDILVKLNVHGMKVKDIPMQAVYGVGEQSKMRIPKVILPIMLLLIRMFFVRMWEKYVVRDTHPLVLFYFVGMIFTAIGLFYGTGIVSVRLILPYFDLTRGLAAALRPLCSEAGMILDVLLTISGFQMILFAMWFDMEQNSRSR
ncbi:MAG: glycosyltransferase family 2 protein [Planctomycetes bacterium]|nr:glycosyltransferase family 2 protein [Planctomycetota bacterium]